MPAPSVSAASSPTAIPPAASRSGGPTRRFPPRWLRPSTTTACACSFSRWSTWRRARRSSTKGCCGSSAPNGTFAPATEFIELSEQLGLIRLVDKHALAKTRRGAGDGAGGAHLAQHFGARRSATANGCRGSPTRSRKQPDLAGRLIVEITETAVIRNLEEASIFVATIHDLGCKVAIDDFGAGFSSFQHLRGARRRHGQDRRPVRARPAAQHRRSGLRQGADRARRHLRHRDRRRMGGGRGNRGHARQARRRHDPGQTLPAWRARSGR